MSVIDGATCNATQSSGCGQDNPPTITVGTNPFWDVVDQATRTVHVANYSGTVSVIDGATCNAETKSGCNQTPPAVTTGNGTAFLSLDASRHTLVPRSTRETTQCRQSIRAPATGARLAAAQSGRATKGYRSTRPRAKTRTRSAFVAQTGTAYLVNGGGESLLQPASITGCSAVDMITCRAEEPTVPQPLFFPVVDAGIQTDLRRETRSCRRSTC